MCRLPLWGHEHRCLTETGAQALGGSCTCGTLWRLQITMGPKYQAEAVLGPLFTLFPQPGRSFPYSITPTHPSTLSSEVLSSAKSPGSTRWGRGTRAAPGQDPTWLPSLNLSPDTETLHLLISVASVPATEWPW